MVESTNFQTVVHVDPPTAEAIKLWTTTLELAQAFEPSAPWALIGGLMVQLHGYEAGDLVRPTTDIDVFGDARTGDMTERIAQTLLDRGGKPSEPTGVDSNLGYQFEIDGETVEVLGSDGLRGDPKTFGDRVTFQVPGGTQALFRTEVIGVSLSGQAPIAVRRPNLLGAILIKARVVLKHRDKFESDRQDLLRLLTYVSDPRVMARDGRLKASERKWLRKVEASLVWDAPALAALFSRQELSLAKATFDLLVGDAA